MGVVRRKSRSVGATDVAWLPIASARVGRAAESARWRRLEADPGVTLPTNMGESAVYLANVGQEEHQIRTVVDAVSWPVSMM